MPAPARVIQVLGKLGVKGVSKVKCKVLEGEDKDKVLLRNIMGPVQEGDIVFLKETAMDTSSRYQRKG
ncbi:MAG: 30S ribosomal protein S28e [Candidatus Aenigmarchaeota archaeon]|nr:30S ribosomal protein S28e [Candidatus Aenigmarchaeota archaeon]